MDSQIEGNGPYARAWKAERITGNDFYFLGLVDGSKSFEDRYDLIARLSFSTPDEASARWGGLHLCVAQYIDERAKKPTEVIA